VNALFLVQVPGAGYRFGAQKEREAPSHLPSCLVRLCVREKGRFMNHNGWR
jgi:hypothetical protein